MVGMGASLVEAFHGGGPEIIYDRNNVHIRMPPWVPGRNTGNTAVPRLIIIMKSLAFSTPIKSLSGHTHTHTRVALTGR